MSQSFGSPEWLRWERACIRRARSGDRAALGELYAAFAPELYRRVLMPKLGNAQAAEDALSETFRTVLGRLDRFEDRGKSIWSWFATIASNKAIDMHRVKARTHRALANFEGLLAPVRGEAERPDLATESNQEREELSRHVRRALETLRPRYRRAIELRFLEDRSRTQCAEALEVKLGTFDVLILRALRAFRTQWETAVAHVEARGAMT